MFTYKHVGAWPNAFPHLGITETLAVGEPVELDHEVQHPLLALVAGPDAPGIESLTNKQLEQHARALGLNVKGANTKAKLLALINGPSDDEPDPVSDLAADGLNPAAIADLANNGQHDESNPNPTEDPAAGTADPTIEEQS